MKQKPNSIQDILNAFREKFTFTDSGKVYLINPQDDEDQITAAQEMSDWLLNTLTEFEREERKKVLAEFKEGYKSLKIVNDFAKKFIEMSQELKLELEKEKHPSK